MPRSVTCARSRGSPVRGLVTVPSKIAGFSSAASCAPRTPAARSTSRLLRSMALLLPGHLHVLGNAVAFLDLDLFGLREHFDDLVLFGPAAQWIDCDEAVLTGTDGLEVELALLI